MDESSQSDSEQQQQQRGGARNKATAAAAAKKSAAPFSRGSMLMGSDEEEDEDEEMQLPLRGRTPNVKAIARQQQKQRAHDLEDADASFEAQEDERAREEEEHKYPVEARRSRGGKQQQAQASSAQQPSRAGMSAMQRKMQHMADVEDALLRQQEEEEEEAAAAAEAAAAEEAEEEEEEEAAATSHGHFAPPPLNTQRLQRAPPPSALSNFLASLPLYTRPSHARDYHPANILAPTSSSASASSAASSSSSSSSRSVLDFHRHSFRAGWSSQGHMLVFAGGIDGRFVEMATLDVLAVDALALAAAGSGSNSGSNTASNGVGVAAIVPVSSGAAGVRSMSDDMAAANARSQKRQAIEACLETHLAFHSHSPSPSHSVGGAAAPTTLQVDPTNPNAGLVSSARIFGAPNAASSASAPLAFAFGQPPAAAASTAAAATNLTPFTRLCDAYITTLKSLIAAKSSPFSASASSAPSSAAAATSELELTLSAFQLLRCLYSKEEAEARAPKLSRSAEMLLLASSGAGAVLGLGATDQSVLTAQQDPYAIETGREASFELGWLQPTIANSFVGPRVRQLQQQQQQAQGGSSGSDGVTGTKMQEVLAYLVGHDIPRATEACIAAGNFRLATILAQAGSFNYTGRLGGAEGGADDAAAPPALESSLADVAQHWQSTWANKDRGLGAFMPEDMLQVLKLLAGDVVVGASISQPRIGWIEALGLNYWYAQPKASHTNIPQALLNYKKHAFSAKGTTVRKPFPAYEGYVPVAERRGGAGAGAAARNVDDEDEGMGQALVLSSGVGGGPSSSLWASAPSSSEFFDVRYGLLDLYTGQERRLNKVLSPQTHVPHVLDHHVAWHLFTTMKVTPHNHTRAREGANPHTPRSSSAERMSDQRGTDVVI